MTSGHRAWRERKASHYAQTVGPGHYSRQGKAKRGYRLKHEAQEGWVGTVYRCDACGLWHRATKSRKG